MESPSRECAENQPQSGAWARFRVVALLMIIALVSHFNRVSIATAGDTRIMKQYGIEPTSMGFVYSAFLLTYTLFMMPGGLVIDRVGARAALMIVTFGSALFVAATGLVGLSLTAAGLVVLGLVLVRGLMGIVSAPLHPACARVVGYWMPRGSQSRANGMVTGAALVGIAAAPPLFGALIEATSWPTAFLIMGGATLLLALAWTSLASDRPLGGGGEAAKSPVFSPAAGWNELLRNRSLMNLTGAYAAIGYFQYMFFYWMSYYFGTVLRLSEERSHYYAAIPPLAMAVGMPLGGWLADRLERERRSAGIRKVVPIAGLTAGALLLLAGVFAREPGWIVTWFALALGAVGMAEGPTWATAIELGGPAGGRAAGLLNTGGNAGGILAPILTPWIGKHLGWGAAIALGAVICVAGVALWASVDPGRMGRIPPDIPD